MKKVLACGEQYMTLHYVRHFGSSGRLPMAKMEDSKFGHFHESEDLVDAQFSEYLHIFQTFQNRDLPVQEQ